VTQFDAATLESWAYLHGLRSFRQMDAQGCAWMEPFDFLDWPLGRAQQRSVVEHTMEQSARQVRARYYRERAASIRARAAASECAAVRAESAALSDGLRVARQSRSVVSGYDRGTGRSLELPQIRAPRSPGRREKVMRLRQSILRRRWRRTRESNHLDLTRGHMARLACRRRCTLPQLCYIRAQLIRRLKESV
jgi:hypothetical protein